MTQDPINIDDLVDLVRSIYGTGFIPLHRPIFEGREIPLLVETIDSTFVSSVGKHVVGFENKITEFTGANFAVATTNGTSALHAALHLVGVKPGDEVISQPLTFVATCNAINYCGAKPIFIDVDEDTLGLSPERLEAWLKDSATFKNGVTVNKRTGAPIRACVPMHTFGLPLRIKELARICREYDIALIEDAAESLGSFVGEKHTGLFGDLAVLSFNGNKTITTGGGGMIITDDEALAKRAKHITTTAKVPHAYEFVHDEIGFNYRLPNLNAALGVAQMERLPEMLKIKRSVASQYKNWADAAGIDFIEAIEGTQSNYWLNAIRLPENQDRDAFLQSVNSRDVMVRPIWRLMNSLPMFKTAEHGGLEVATRLEREIINLPSSVPDGTLSKYV